MRILCMLLLATNLVTIGKAQLVEGNKRPCTISLKAEKLIVKAGDPVLVTLQLKNISNQELIPGWGGASDSLGVIDGVDRFDVRDLKGHSIPKKSPQPSKFPLSSGMSFGMKPDETRSYQQDFSRWYDLSQPGSYTIQASRLVSENGKEALLKSNKITITITK
jgi:hypothetical protein